MKLKQVEFIKNNGDTRVMKFVSLEDLPREFLMKKIIGNPPQPVPKHLIRVWDVEKSNFRYINLRHKAGPIRVIGDIEVEDLE